MDIPYIDPPPDQPDGNGHLSSCGEDCLVGEMDPFLARVLEQYGDLLRGLSPDEEDRLMRNSWIDDDGMVHVRRLGVVDGDG